MVVPKGCVARSISKFSVKSREVCYIKGKLYMAMLNISWAKIERASQGGGVPEYHIWAYNYFVNYDNHMARYLNDSKDYVVKRKRLPH